MDVQRVIDEARPMLEEFLVEIGFHHAQNPLNFPRLLEPFSRWVAAQEIADDDRIYLASRLAAFICEYLIEVRSGQRVVEDGRILMIVPVEVGVARTFDPYAVAVGLVTNRSSLMSFLDAL